MSSLPHTTDVVRRKVDVPAHPNEQVDHFGRPRFTPAAKAFGTVGVPRYSDEKRQQPLVVEARYVGNVVERVTQYVLRSEFKSLIILLLVMAGVFLTLGLVAFAMGVL